MELAWLREENARLLEETGRLREQNAQLLRPNGTSAALQAANQTELTHCTISNATQNDAEGNLASRTRRHTRMRARDEEEEEKQRAAHSSVHVSPAMRVYRHALESVFGMLQLEDLSQILAVNREWSAAVRSMKPIHASIERSLPPIASIVDSPILRHLAAIHIGHVHARTNWTPLDNASLRLLAQHAPHLTSLRCQLRRAPDEPLVLPAKLASLDLYADHHCSGAAINRVVTTLAALPSLSRLKLDMYAVKSLELRLLAACRSLTDLTFAGGRRGKPQLSDTQVDQIRISLGHLRRISIGWIKFDVLARLLQPPVTARWQDIGAVSGDARNGELLFTLPTLTRLDLTFEAAAANVDFLPQLPLVTSLDLSCFTYHDVQQPWLIPADALLATLVRWTSPS